MKCYVCGEEITRDMTDINNTVLMIPRGIKTPWYICLECEEQMRVDWDDVDEQEANVLKGIYEGT